MYIRDGIKPRSSARYLIAHAATGKGWFVFIFLKICNF
jgi:hypothetical protein